MITLRDCDLQPGDIIFLVSSSNNPLIRLKRALQSFTGKDRKHGHMEVVSVFVCTGGDGKPDSFGYQFHNYERQLRLSEPNFIDNLYQKSPEKLPTLLQSYCARKELTANKIKSQLLLSTHPWMQQLGQLIKDEDSPEQVVEKMLYAAEQPDKASEKYGIDVEKRSKLIDLILFCWKVSGHAEVLPSVNSSLLVFRHNDPKIRDQFLEEYMRQVEVTKAFKSKGKVRTSIWKIFLSLFVSSAQDKYDRDQTRKPSDETFCAQNVIQVLNKVDPNLVNRGRYVTPKSLESGMRAATKQARVDATPSTAVQTESAKEFDFDDDLEALLQEEERKNPLPPFKMRILPKSGTDLIKNLSQAVEKELHRMNNKWWKNALDLKKIADLELQLAPFKALQIQKYTISAQVDAAFEFLHRSLPILQRKTGWFGSWIRATSHANIRAFARTQGIFDGDLRDYAEQVKNEPSSTPITVLEEPRTTLAPEKHLTYLFSDWSFSDWSAEKRATILSHMIQLLSEGHSIYLWNGKQKQLVEMNNQQRLTEIINQEDLDKLWSDKIEPITNKQLLVYAEQQNLDLHKVNLLDYKTCNALAKKELLTEPLLASAATLFTPDFNPGSVQKTKLTILNIEIENAADDAELVAQLQQMHTKINNEQNEAPKYHSGIDTKAAVEKTHI